MADTEKRPDSGAYDDAPLDETAQRLLNLAFILNAARRPLRTEEIVSDSDLGYGSSNRESDLRKFRRDRERLAAQGICVVEVRDEGASRREEGAWTIDRGATFAAGGLIQPDDARLLVHAIDEYTSWHATPLATPLRAIRRAAAEALGGPEIEQVTASEAGEGGTGACSSAASAVPDPVADAVWTAFSLRRALRCAYTDARGARTERAIATYGVFTHHGIAYLAGLDSASDSVRTFRIDRIDAITGLGERYAVPRDFDIRSYLFLPFDLAPGEGVAASFSFPAARTPSELDAITLGRGTCEHATDGSWTWHITVHDLDAAARFALAHARDGMRPVAPSGLVRAWNQAIHEAVHAHEC